jgi:hypothetical protein
MNFVIFKIEDLILRLCSHEGIHPGTPELGGRRGSRHRCPLPGGARGAKVPF